MKVRNVQSNADEKVEVQMTPMIDIVFQLLIFFIMTFKIVAQEGDFNIKMPLSAPSEGLPEEEVRKLLKAAGFRWVKKRGKWAHNCGRPCRSSKSNPWDKYDHKYVSIAS